MNSTECTGCDLTGNTLPKNDVRPESDTIKICRKCGQLKYRSDFYTDKRKVKDKTLTICKLCSDRQHKDYTLKNLEKHKEYQKSYKTDPTNRRRILESKKKYRENNREKCNKLTIAWQKHKMKTDPYFRAVIKSSNTSYKSIT